MRTKLFLAFIFIIFLALLSNVVFERLVISDFDDYLRGTKEDHIYWIMAAVEGSYKDKKWDITLLGEAVHWSLMMGFEAYVEDVSGERVLSSSDILSSMNPNMLDRMSSLLNLSSGRGEFTWYPLYVKGDEIGKLHVRSIERLGTVQLKEEIFRKRGRGFLMISFLIAGAGALVLAVLFSIFLSYPVRRLTIAAERIAKGDFSVQGPRVHKKNKDEIDKLTETFNYMSEALKREDLLRKHLTSNITHELRTPLTVIKGNLEAIEDGVISDTDKATENIKSEIHRMISLVEGIEDVTRAEASFFKRGEMKEVNLKEFIETMAGGMMKLIHKKRLVLNMNGPALTVRTYPEKLHIILKNLLTNAYKYTRNGGITVTWDRRDAGAEGFYISIEDTGAGIARDDLSQIFDRFYKGRDSGGQGLGLAIVKELTEVIGGTVEVESIPDRGSKFTVVFMD